MLDQEAIPSVRSGHKAVAATPGLPFVAFEGCRERLSECLTYFHVVAQQTCNSCRP